MEFSDVLLRCKHMHKKLLYTLLRCKDYKKRQKTQEIS